MGHPRRIFTECSDSEEEESPPPKKSHQEDEPSTNTEPSKSTPSTDPSFNMVIAMSEGSLHDLGISLEFLLIHEQLPHRKAIYVCAFNCGYHAQSRATACIHTHMEHLNTFLGCPQCDHHVWPCSLS